MAKFTSKSDLKRSLLDNITLLYKEEEYIWCEFHEIEEKINQGFHIFNDQKKELYEKFNRKST